MKTPAQLLKEIAAIGHMERGTLCRMNQGPKRPFYNHQTWTDGRNVVAYVPRDQVPALRQAIAGYARFVRLTKAYADQIIENSRRIRAAQYPPKPRTKGKSRN